MTGYPRGIDGRGFGTTGLTTTASNVAALLLCIKGILCIKGSWGWGPGRAQSRDSAKGYSPPRPIALVSGSQHFARFVPMATFPPTQCPTAPASYLSARAKWDRTARTRTQAPFVMPLGDPGLVCPRSRYLNPSARDRGGRRCKAPQVLLSVSFSEYSMKELRVCI